MRIVSLVPSLTETLAVMGLDETSLVGRTSWCIHPAELVAKVPTFGGTKTPNLKRIKELRPDLVVLDREENRREHAEELEAAGIPVWVGDARTVAAVPETLVSLGHRVGQAAAGEALAREVRTELEETDRAVAALERPRSLPLIWHDPLMAVSCTRYAGDLVRRAGFDVPDPVPGQGYPALSPDAIGRLGCRYLLLTSEPHDFTEEEGEAIADAVAAAGHERPRAIKVDGEALTWFGARSAAALKWWRDFRLSLETPASAPGESAS